MQLTGAEIIVECLKEQGVDTVFGYPGGAILNVYDALYEYKDSGLMSRYYEASEDGDTDNKDLSKSLSYSDLCSDNTSLE